jgi:hypothetical protein
MLLLRSVTGRDGSGRAALLLRPRAGCFLSSVRLLIVSFLSLSWLALARRCLLLHCACCRPHRRDDDVDWMEWTWIIRSCRCICHRRICCRLDRAPLSEFEFFQRCAAFCLQLQQLLLLLPLVLPSICSLALPACRQGHREARCCRHLGLQGVQEGCPTRWRCVLCQVSATYVELTHYSCRVAACFVRDTQHSETLVRVPRR